MRLAVEAAVFSEQVPKPVLLYLAQFGSVLCGAFAIVFMLGNLHVIFRGGEFRPLESFFRYGIVPLILGGMLIAIGIGLWRERTWARPLILAFCGVNAAAVILANSGRMYDALPDLAPLAVWTVFAWWYLYDKENVTAYYDGLRALKQRAVAKA